MTLSKPMIVGGVAMLLCPLKPALSQELSEKPNIVFITSEDNSKHYMRLFDENGVETPHIERLAEGGLTFTRAFSNAPVCSAARSALISGCYGPRIGANYHRKMEPVPMPNGLKMFPAYLRQAGYYTTNNYKEDYNIIKTDDVWDESSKTASWRNRQKGQPFFHVFNIHTTHESRVHFTREDMANYQTKTDLNSFDIQPNHPQTDLFRYTNAYYRDKVQKMDGEVGEVLAELRKDGLLENTIIFYFGDHGGVLPGSKAYSYETGLHVPLVVYVPEKYRDRFDVDAGSKVDGFVSFVDFGPTVLSLAGVEVPKGVDGQAFMGKDISMKAVSQRDETYSYADRFDEKYDMVRAVRKGRFKYLRNYQPFNYDGLMNNYRYKQLAYQEWLNLYQANELNDKQSFFFESRPPEQLFDVEADPFETNNLANDPAYGKVLQQMRGKLNDWVKGMPDLSFYPEHVLIREAFDNPVVFGQNQQEEIKQYVAIADLALVDFSEAKPLLKQHLKSEDPATRYWALIVCSCFGKEAKCFKKPIKQIAKEDFQALNRARAAEYLGITGYGNPVKTMTEALYTARHPVEGLLILNSIVLMQDGSWHYDFDIQLDKIPQATRDSYFVRWRLQYLKLIEENN